jgi:hypothetical protein
VVEKISFDITFILIFVNLNYKIKFNSSSSMHKLLEFFNQYATQSKYDYRGNSQPFINERVLLADLTLNKFDDIKDKELTFHTIYAGNDPIDKSRKLIKKIVKIPVDLGKYGG